VRVGFPALPFVFAAGTAVAAELLVLLMPRTVWRGRPARPISDVKARKQRQQDLQALRRSRRAKKSPPRR